MDPSLTPANGSTECDRLLTVYASSIKPSLHYLNLLWSPTLLFSLAPALQSSSCPFLPLQTQSVSHTYSALFSSLLSYTAVRSPLLHSSLKALVRMQIWNMCTFVSNPVYGHTYANRHTCIHTWIHTYTRILQCSPVSVGLAPIISFSVRVNLGT